MKTNGSAASRRSAAPRSILADMSWLGISQVVAQLCTAGAGVIVARVGGVDALGLITIGLGLVAVSSDLLDFGCGANLGREVSSGRVPLWSALRLTLHRFVVVGGVAAVVGCVLVLIFDGAVAAVSGMLCAYLVSGGSLIAISILLRASQRVAAAAIVGMCDRVVLLALTLLLTAVGTDARVSFCIGLLAGSSVGVVYGSLVFYRVCRSPDSNTGGAHSLRQLYRDSRGLGMAGLASDVLALEGPAVGLFAGITIAGQFGAAQRFAGPLGIPGSAVSTALLPRLTAVSSAFPSVIREVRNVRLVLPVIVVGLSAVAWLADWLVPFVLGASFGEATVGAVRLVCLLVLIKTLNDVAFAVCVAVRLDRVLYRVVGCCVPGGVLVTVFGAVIGGAPWAVCGSILGQTCTLALLLVSLRRYGRSRQNVSGAALSKRTEDH